MTYIPLTQDERYQIAILVKANHWQSAIAQIDEQTQIDHQPENPTKQRIARLPAQAGAPIISVTHDRP